MRISEYKKADIKRTILNDLYVTAENALNERKEQIALENYSIRMAPLLPTLNSLPVEFVSHIDKYIVEIKYKRIPDMIDKYELVDAWSCIFIDKQFGPVDYTATSYYTKSPPRKEKLVPQLYDKAAVLAEDIIALNTERKSMERFLQNVFDRWSGPKQLRAALPETLHKYLPAIKSQKPRKTNKDKTADTDSSVIAVPDALNTRLTTNLLEGS